MTFSPQPPDLAVIPILFGPLQVLLALLPVILMAMGSALLALLKPRTLKLLLRLLWRVKFTVVAAAAVSAGLYLGLRPLWPRHAGAVSAAEAGAHDWALFRGSPQRTGAQPGTDSPAAGRINWAFSEAGTVYASPAVVGNRVYVSSAEKGPLTDRGQIYCLDVDTGGLVWKNAPERYLATFSSPAVSGRYLVVGEGLHTTRSARIVCLDRERDGAVLWTYATKSHVESAPVIADGRVYIGAGDDGYYCFQLEPGPKGEPVLVWHLSGAQYPDAETSPAAAGGKVYFGLGVNGHALVCVDAATGREVWRVATPSPVFTPPTLANGKVLIGMGHANFVQGEEEVIAGTRERLRKAGRSGAEIAAATQAMAVNGAVWCVDQATGNVDWRQGTDRTILGAVAAGDDRVFAATRAGTVYALGFDGRELARWEAHAPVLASPALTDKCLYVITQDGRLYGLDRGSLQPVWQIAIGSGANYISSPAVARGRVYVGTPDNGLVCAGVPGADAEKPLWAGPRGGPDRTGCADGSALPERGAVAWVFPPAVDDGAAKPPVVSGGLASAGGRLYVPLAGGPRLGVVCLRGAAAAQAEAEEVWFCRTPRGVATSPAADESRVFFVDGAPGDESRRLQAVDAQTGVTLWTNAVTAGASGAMLLGENGLIVQDAAGSLACLGPDGAPRWRVALAGTALPPCRFEGIAVVAAADPASLRALDAATGALLWHVAVEGTPRTPPLVDGRRVYVGTDRGVAAHSLVRGDVVWSAASPPPGAGTMARAPGALVYTGGNGELVLLDPERGTARVAASDALAAVPPLVTRDAVLYATRASLVLLRPNGAKPSPWMDASWLGAITAPPILSDGIVYFATETYGVVSAGRER